MTKAIDAMRDAFTEWHAGWWLNKPNPQMERNARAAFYAGWAAHSRHRTHRVTARSSSSTGETK